MFNVDVDVDVDVDAKFVPYFFSFITAWAAARRAMGTRKGEQLT